MASLSHAGGKYCCGLGMQYLGPHREPYFSAEESGSDARCAVNDRKLSRFHFD